MASRKTDKITTIKLKIETKQRLDHLKEYGRESYDEIIKKILYILNILRTSPEASQGILRNIDLKLKRKSQVYPSKPQENNTSNKPESKETKKITKLFPPKILNKKNLENMKQPTSSQKNNRKQLGRV
jgi:hypothetical protein